jgi:hypothetical protein
MSATNFQLRDVQRHPFTRHDRETGGSYWTARIVIGGKSYDIDSRGGWVLHLPDGKRKHLLPSVAAAVQSRMPSEARRRRGSKG